MIADSSALDMGILFLRLVVGITMAAHGFQKFFGKGGIGQVAAWFDSIGMKPGRFNAIMAASTETAAGIALALGLFTPLAAAAYVALMVVAVWTVHRHGFFATKGGWEYNLVLGAAAVTVATLGAGHLSADHVLFTGTGIAGLLCGWAGLLIAVLLGVAGAVGQLAIFFRPPAPTAGSED